MRTAATIIVACLGWVSASAADDLPDLADAAEEPRPHDAVPHEARRRAQRPAATLDEIEATLDDLGDRVWRSRATLSLLRSMLDVDPVRGARLAVVPDDDLGRAFELRGWEVWVDGAQVHADRGPVPLDGVAAWRHDVTPGLHHVEVVAHVTGGGGRLFGYLRDFDFTVRSGLEVAVEPGTEVSVRAVADTRSPLTHGYRDRPTIRWSTTVWSLRPGGVTVSPHP